MSANSADRAIELLNIPLSVDQRLDLIALLWKASRIPWRSCQYPSGTAGSGTKAGGGRC